MDLPESPTAEELEALRLRMAQLEESLRASEERYRQLLSAVTTYTYLVKFDNGAPVATEHGAGCVSATGYRPEDFAADRYLWINMVHPDDRELVRRHVAEILDGADVPAVEHRILHRDGSTRWVRSTVVQHRDGAGYRARYQGLVEDITDRKRAEERFRQLLESAPDAVVVVDAAGRIALVSAQTEQVFGYSRDELLGKPVELLIPESDRKRHQEHRTDYSARPRIRPMGGGLEFRALRKDGREFPAEISLSPLQTDEGLLVFADIRDITERKRVEKANRENEIQLLTARRIQEHLLPHSPPAIAGFDVAGASSPAESAGGDYFDYLAMPDDAVGFVVGDVCGHGVGPALLAASTQALLRVLAEAHRSPSAVLAHANRFLVRTVEQDRFVTLFLGRLDPGSRRFTYSSAGHPTGYVLDRAGAVRAALASTALPLGITVQEEFLSAEPLTLEPGEMILLLTDGVLDAISPAGEAFGPNRALEIVRTARHQSAKEILDGLLKAVRDFSGDGQLSDDVTAVVVKVE